MRDDRFLSLIQHLNQAVVHDYDLEHKLSFTMGLIQTTFDLEEIHLVVHEAKAIIESYHSTQKSTFYKKLSNFLNDKLEKYQLELKVLDDKHAYALSLGSFATLYGIRLQPFNQEELNEYVQVITFLDQFFYALKQTEIANRQINKYFEERQFFRQVLDTIPDMVAFKDTQGQYKLINEAARKFYKPKFGDLEGKTIDDIYPPDDAALVKALDQEAIDARKTIYKRFKMFQADNPEGQWVESIRTPVYENSGVFKGVITMSRDVDEVEKERRVNERNIQFQSILLDLASEYINVHVEDNEAAINDVLKKTGEFIGADRTYVFLYHFDRNLIEYRYEWCNDGVEPYIEVEEVKFNNIDDFMGDWVELHIEGKNVYIPSVASLDHDSIAYKTLSLQDIQSLIAIPLMHLDRCLGFVGFDDVKDERAWDKNESNLLNVMAHIISNMLVNFEQEQQLIDSKMAADRANEAKSLFLANVSHEIRTPLAAMSNALYILNQSHMSSDAKEMVNVLNISLNNMSGLINNILDITKIESQVLVLQDDWFDLETMMCDILKTQKPFADQKGLELYFDYDYDLPLKFYGDAFKVQQIIVNLINNALKFTTEGYVIVSAKLKRTKHKRAYITLSVTDTGVGIKNLEPERLVEKFYRIDDASSPKQSGTGLGLTIVHQLIERLGGKLEIASEYGRGSVFSTTLSFAYQDTLSFLAHPAFQDRRCICLITSHKTQEQRMIQILDSIQYDYTPMSLEDFLAREDLTPFDAVVILYGEAFEDYLENIQEKLRNTNIYKVLYTDQLKFHQSFERFKSDVDLIIDYCASRATIMENIVHYYEEQFQPKSKAMAETKKPLANATILMVEDNPLNRLSLALILRQRGYHVIEAESGEDALETDSAQSFDVVMLDIQLPGIDGVETMRQLKKQLPNASSIPFIAMTAHAFKDKTEVYLKAGFDEVFTKPVQMTTLLSFLNDSTKNLEHTPTIKRSTNTFDYETVLENFDHQADIVMNMLTLFMNRFDRDIEEIEDALNQKDIGLYKRLIHTFKGSLAYLAADDLTPIIDHLLEQLVKDDDQARIQRFKTFKRKLLSWYQTLETFVENTKETDHV